VHQHITARNDAYRADTNTNANTNINTISLWSVSKHHRIRISNHQHTTKYHCIEFSNHSPQHQCIQHTSSLNQTRKANITSSRTQQRCIKLSKPTAHHLRPAL
jgi:hypothetical protein